MSEEAKKPAPRPKGWTALIGAVAGLIAGAGGHCSARAAMPTEMDAVKVEIVALRAEVKGALERLVKVEIDQAVERGRQLGLKEAKAR